MWSRAAVQQLVSAAGLGAMPTAGAEVSTCMMIQAAICVRLDTISALAGSGSLRVSLACSARVWSRVGSSEASGAGDETSHAQHAVIMDGSWTGKDIKLHPVSFKRPTV